MRLFLLVAVFTLPLLSVSAADVPADVGSAMEGYPSPFPVRYFPLDVEGQALRMAYFDVAPTGSPNGRSVVLLHGKNFFSAYWRDTIAVLAQAGFRVVAVDQIGFGRSSKPDLAYSVHLLAANTKALLDSLQIKRVNVLAHSMGGMVGIRFTLLYPEFVEKMVLEDPLGLEDYRLVVPYASLGELVTATAAETEASAVKFHEGYYPEWQPAFAEWAYLQARSAQGGEGPRVIRASALTYQMIYEQPVCYEIQRLRPPTFLIVGEKDRAALGKNRVSEEVRSTMGRIAEIAKRLEPGLPAGSRLVILPGVGHVPHLQTPARFHEELLQFLK